MTTPLNLYATKVFSEQPIALWALDDTTDYVSLVDSSNQDLNTWTIDGATAVNAKTDISFAEKPPTEPFSNSYVSGVIETLGNDGNITLKSPNGFNTGDLNVELGSFALGAYFFTYDRTVSVHLGYEYEDPDTLITQEVTRSNQIPVEREWGFVSQTFQLPESYNNLKFVIRVIFSETETPYEFAVNGINIGQWAEEFHVESLGVSPQALPESLDIDSLGVPALPYGLEGAEGYYLSRDGILYAKNSGLPLVYGAFNSTVIHPNTNRPSLVIPGYGFMNESGKYKNFTAEFWAKVQSNSVLPKRIFGPISSTDGLYVEGPFLKLKINDIFQSHYVGEWNRPMLFNIRLKPERASLVLNGEEVISFETDPEAFAYPEKNNEIGKDQDWLGFYAYESVPVIQIDCVGIYPYEVPAVVAKRRFVYGQGVETPNNIKGLNQANSVFIDYPFAKYAKNYSYPRIGSWSGNVAENILPNAQELTVPEYTLPNIRFDNKTVPEWYADIESAQPISGSNFINLKPDSEWSSTNGHILFESLNMLQEETKCFYGVFEIESFSNENQILFYLVNETKGSSLSLELEKRITDIDGGESYTDYLVSYTLRTKSANGQTVTKVFYESIGHLENTIFLSGIHIPRFIENFGESAATFFGSKQNIKVFVGGMPDYTKTFDGRIYRVGFSTSRNLQKIESLFTSAGIPLDYENVFNLYSGDAIHDAGFFDTDFWEFQLDGGDPSDFEKIEILPHLASYTLVPKIEFGKYKLDIGIDSYWESYVPLTYFGKYVLDSKEEKQFALDFLQLNIDYPKMNNFVDQKYNTAGALVKTYVTFQYLSVGSGAVQSKFTNIEPLSYTGVVRPGEEWLYSKYEVLDDTVIYPPIGVNFNDISVNIHIELSVPGIISNPVKIRSLQLSSQALGSSPNKIGSRFGAELFPYSKYGTYTDYKSVKPFSVYKRSSPYFYTTSNSGIRSRGEFSVSGANGISLQINKNRNRFFKVSAFQMALKYDDEVFPAAPVPIFEIEDINKKIIFYLVAEKSSSKRGYIYAINENSGRPETDVIYNLDGKAVNKAAVNLNSWFVLGLAFRNPLDFSDFVGAFRVTNPILFNSVSYYQITEADEAENFSYRKWYAVRSEPDNTLDWDYWDEESWQQVLFLSEAEPTILDPSKIYRQYTGTDRITFASDYNINLQGYRYSFFKDVKWSRQVLDSA